MTCVLVIGRHQIEELRMKTTQLIMKEFLTRPLNLHSHFDVARQVEIPAFVGVV